MKAPTSEGFRYLPELLAARAEHEVLLDRLRVLRFDRHVFRGARIKRDRPQFGYSPDHPL